jgi:two-component system CheB/CheR fusion protein
MVEKKAKSKRERTEIEFPIVGIGASAGGLESFEQFFRKMPPDSGMAFVVIQHLDPTHVSGLTDLLQRYTKMSVFEATDGAQVRPNSVYVIPPHKDMVLVRGTLQLVDQTRRQAVSNTIDIFFRSLAEERQARAICIVLSGAATDGTSGLEAIKAGLGMAMVQDPVSAKYDSMPRSAIATELADFILPPAEMPEKLISYVQRFYGKPATRLPEAAKEDADSIHKIFFLVRMRTKHDFSGYKLPTLKRRIERRMSVNQFDKISDYIRLLEENPNEVDSLGRDFLINVTSFFREPEAFDSLKEKMKDILKDKTRGSAIRMWTVGCSSGEEAYSLVITIKECMDELGREFRLQAFGSDIDNHAVNRARAGIYPLSIAADVGEERLKRFFISKDNAYHIKREIRETTVFAVQDIINDPPFSKMDLISCRNLLIYLNRDTQKKVIPLLHYAMNTRGILFLGSSETIREFTDLFSELAPKWKIYGRKEQKNPAPMAFPIRPLTQRKHGPPPVETEVVVKAGARQLAEKVLLEALPPSVLIDEKRNVIYVHGEIDKYLKLPRGEIRLSLLEMAREGLRAGLTSAIQEASSQNKEVHRESLRVKSDGGIQLINVSVRPVAGPEEGQGRFVVVFQDAGHPEEQGLVKPGPKTTNAAGARIAELEQELEETRESLHSRIEELETGVEELQSTDEEFQSTNEELQSTNEELLTSQEELQSVNEELVTVNAEQQSTNASLSALNDDLINLFSSTDIAVVFLDEELSVKRYTPTATTLFSLIAIDIGRPIYHITTALAYDNLAEDAKEVLNTLIPVEKEVKTKDGRWFTIRIFPYRTSENAIAGLVLTFVETSRLQKLNQELKAAMDYANSIVATLREPFLILDAELRVISANHAFYRTFQVEPGETEGQLIFHLGDGQWDIPRLRELLEDVLPKNSTFEGFEVDHDFPNVGRRKIILNARQLFIEGGTVSHRVLLAMEDVTER